ncbi:taste receptor type 2 member 41-like [Sceloporus undulatus]|uniref:taste receptor type 2 member 41-like n=1 Tax=Sceloporus undulatus TaxID=8520 RepID=UPI001C4C6EA2|nr:taste receptor type 2 member 41-like [Sceloporus undulatus]
MSILNIIYWIIFGIVCLIGILANGFIVVVNGHQWLQNMKMGPYDILLASLSTSRFLAQSTILVTSFLICCFPKTNLYNSLKKLIHFSWTFPNMVSDWCATWLNVFYCVKVTNFANPLFLWIKARINVLIPRMLGMSILVSMVFYLYSFVSFEHKECYNVTGTLSGNASENEVCKSTFIYFVPVEFSFSSANFFLSTTASILLIISLHRHTRNLKKSGLGVKDLSTQVHMKVMISLLFYLFFYLVYFIGMIIYTKSIINKEEFDKLPITILFSLFPSAHSIILILTNPKLKEMALVGPGEGWRKGQRESVAGAIFALRGVSSSSSSNPPHHRPAAQRPRSDAPIGMPLPPELFQVREALLTGLALHVLQSGERGLAQQRQRKGSPPAPSLRPKPWAWSPSTALSSWCLRGCLPGPLPASLLQFKQQIHTG